MVIQMGARRNYIYARQLEQAGLLHSLVTDMAWSASGGGWGAALARVAPSMQGAIARRTVVGVPASKLRATMLPNLARAILWWRDPEDRFVAADEALALSCKMRGLGDARIIVNYLGNGGSFLDHAKARGARVATDFICMPRVWEIEEEERRRWPAWGGTPVSRRIMDDFRARIRHLLAISDIYLCPSRTVANDLATLPEFVPDRVRLTPYGPGGFIPPVAMPRIGRVLFAGACLPRKGLPYLGHAASMLADAGGGVEVVVAGEATDLVRQQPEVRNLHFLGRLDRTEMARELSQADLFCLPSLTEGSSSAIFEALASGVPVVTTPSSGSVVQDGIDGFVVPERDARAIAEAIRRIAQDRDLRRRMSQAALATAACYTDEACGAAFVNAINQLGSRHQNGP